MEQPFFGSLEAPVLFPCSPCSFPDLPLSILKCLLHLSPLPNSISERYECLHVQHKKDQNFEEDLLPALGSSNIAIQHTSLQQSGGLVMHFFPRV